MEINNIILTLIQGADLRTLNEKEKQVQSDRCDGKISEDSAECIMNAIAEQKEKKYVELIERRFKDVHSSPIRKGKGKDKRWHTRVRELDGTLREVQKTTLEAIEREMALHYYDTPVLHEDGTEVMTIRSLYPAFIEKQKKRNVVKSTFDQYESYWKNYYVGNSFLDKPIQDVTASELEDWELSLLSGHRISKQTYFNIIRIMNGIMKVAMSERVITANTLQFTDVGDIDNYELERRNKVKDEGRTGRGKNEGLDIFSDENLVKFSQTAWVLFEKTRQYKNVLAFLAFLFMIQTALRPNEVLALKKSDIEGEVVHVQRMYTEHGRSYREIKEYTKSHKEERCMGLSAEALRILSIAEETQRKLYGEREYLFSANDTPMTYETLKRTMKIICEQAGIKKHKPYACRKSCITALVDSNNFTIAQIAEMCGNSVDVIFDTYYKNRNKDYLTSNKMDDSLKSLSVVKG